MHRRNRASLEGIIEDEDLGIEALHPGGVTLSREFAGQLALRNRAQVLEVASGTGETACMLASEFGARLPAWIFLLTCFYGRAARNSGDILFTASPMIKSWCRTADWVLASARKSDFSAGP